MKTFDQHIQTITKKNYWYGQNYGLKHVVTESDLDADFKANSILILAKGHHDIEDKNINEYCFHKEPHYHYIIEVPITILAEAYNQKRSWATIVGLDADIIKAKGYGTIKTKQHLQNITRYIEHYNGEEMSEESESEADSEADYISDESSKSEHSDSELERKFEQKIKQIKKKKHYQETKQKFKQSEKNQEKFQAEQSAKRAQELQLRAKLDRDKKLAKIRGAEYLNDTEKDELEKEQNYKAEVTKIFPKWLHTTQVDVDEAKAGVEQQTILKKITNAYAYIQACKMNDLHTQKNKPLTIDEIAEIESLPGFKHTEKYMLKMMHSMYLKLFRDNKCCIFWICGVPSSGKSLFMSILGNIMGPRVGLDKTKVITFVRLVELMVK